MLPDRKSRCASSSAPALGSFIGFERERLLWAAGIRTHMVVCVGARTGIISSHPILGGLHYHYVRV